MTIHGTLPVWTWPLLLLVAAGAVSLVVRLYARTRPAAPHPLDRLLVGLRIAAVLLLVLGVAGPVVTLTGDREEPARLAVVVEDSGSMGLADAGPGAGDGTPATRWEAALRGVREIHRGLEERTGPVDLVLLRGNGLDPLREFGLGDPAIPDPVAHGTDLGALVGQVDDRLAGRSARAVVLFSDGQETGRGSGRRPRSGTGAPLLVVEVGDPRGPADRMIKELRYPEAVFAGDEVVVDFAVDHRFASAADSALVRVTLTGPGGVEEEVVLDGALGYLPGEISFVPRGTGLQVFELSVSPLDNERFLANNRATLAVDVRRERARILLVAPTPGWDVRFLAQAASREERLELAVAYPTPDGLVLADSLVPWSGTAGADPWDGWEGIVLLGLPREDAGWDWDALADAVRAGAGLLVMPGPGGDPGAAGYGTTPPAALANLLPVVAATWRPESGSWFLTPAAGQAGHPILEGLVSRSADGAPGRLAALPPLESLVRVRPRDGAEVLVLATERTVPDETAPPLLVAWPRDRGRVVWFGGRRLWELAFWDYAGPDRGDSEQPARRLLRNLLVWVGAGEEEAGLVLTGRKPFFQEGERIRLSGRWRDVRGRPVSDRPVTLELRSVDADSNRVRTFAMRPEPGEPGSFQATVPPLPPGDYRIRLRGEGDPPVLGDEEALVVAAHSVEVTQVRTDRRRLMGLAAAGEGAFYSANDSTYAAELVARLATLDWRPDRVTDRHRLDFWSSWPFLLLVTLLLGLEWFVRRRQGQL